MILMDVHGHLVSTVSGDELHEFAQRLGLLRKWYQLPQKNEWHAHYDLTTMPMKIRAEDMGAKLVSSESVIRLAWWNPTGRLPHEEGGRGHGW